MSGQSLPSLLFISPIVEIRSRSIFFCATLSANTFFWTSRIFNDCLTGAAAVDMYLGWCGKMVGIAAVSVSFLGPYL
jgi:hypothetical protein